MTPPVVRLRCRSVPEPVSEPGTLPRGTPSVKHRHHLRLLPAPTRFVIAAALLLAGLFVLPASATGVTAAIVQDGGCTTGSFGPDDDRNTGPVGLPFSMDLYGSTYNAVYVNTNGMVTF